MYFYCNQQRRKSQFSLAWASWPQHSPLFIHIVRDVNPCPCPCGLLKDFFQVLVLVLVLGGQVLVLILVLGGSGPGGPCPCHGPWGSGPCPYPGPCGLVLVLVFSPYKDLFPLFQFIRIIYYIVLSTHTISFYYTYLCLFCRHLALRL